MKTKRRTRLLWPTRPVKRIGFFGDPVKLWRADDGRSAVAYTLTVDSVDVPPPHYKAIVDGIIISRHKSKTAAMRACQRYQ